MYLFIGLGCYWPYTNEWRFIVANACPSSNLNRSGDWDSQNDGDYIVGWGLNWVCSETVGGDNQTRVHHGAYSWYQDGHGNDES